MSAGKGIAVSTIANVRVSGPGRQARSDAEPSDVVIAGGEIVDIAPRGALRAAGEVLDGDGGWLVPGLWDHHVHMNQWARIAHRVPLGRAQTAAEAATLIGAAAPDETGVRVGIGFRDGLWADAPSLAVLDAATGAIPSYLLSADLHSVWLNSAAFARAGFPANRRGMLREDEAFAVMRHLDRVDTARVDVWVADAAADAAARGIVGVVDLDMEWNEEAWARRISGGFDALRVDFGVYPDMLGRALAEGLRSGDLVRGVTGERAAFAPLARVGALKVISDGSLGTRTAACTHPYPGGQDRGRLNVDRAELLELMTRATAGGLACAVHAIGDVACSHALDVFGMTGAWGSIEHAQLVSHVDIQRFARLGVAASIQPTHALDDRALVEAYWSSQTALAYPMRALADAGATLLFGSDAPVSPIDPWATIADAVGRARGGDEAGAWHPEQAVTVEQALAASSRGGAGVVRPGAAADLAILGDDPFASSPEALRGMAVRATLLGGRVTHLAS
ncbi:MAG: amidohydrolase family protein [Microbacteriaceae bacterium]|nr:amidohydrolase family protein [Microbacteriaceae bacterium]HOA87605.1 amidohydrolase family protein [Microbacteriaceae bacterium]HPZ35171.1 amidohydrolase family protein [Microbacteriaceae bacterium]HQC93635.1 amidohydrolase family protein [Microbacteriaceae bacterium]